MEPLKKEAYEHWLNLLRQAATEIEEGAEEMDEDDDLTNWLSDDDEEEYDADTLDEGAVPLLEASSSDESDPLSRRGSEGMEQHEGNTTTQPSRNVYSLHESDARFDVEHPEESGDQAAAENMMEMEANDNENENENDKIEERAQIRATRRKMRRLTSQFSRHLYSVKRYRYPSGDSEPTFCFQFLNV